MGQLRRRRFPIVAANAPGLVIGSSTPAQTTLRGLLRHSAQLHRGLAALLVALSAIGTTWAQSYPAKPVKLIVPNLTLSAKEGL